MYQNILVAVDGSDGSLRAFEQGARLALAFEAKLHLVHAYPSTADIVGSSDYLALLDRRKELGRTVLDSMRAKLSSSLPEPNALLREGPAAEAVLSAAEELGVDLIVIGSRGLAAVERWLLGSVSHKVSHLAKCSVLIVR